MGIMQSYLREKQNDLHDPIDSVLYGPLTQNKSRKVVAGALVVLKRMEKAS